MDSARQDHKSISGQKLLLQQYSLEDLVAEKNRLLARLKECEQLDTELSERMMDMISKEGMKSQQAIELAANTFGGYKL